MVQRLDAIVPRPKKDGTNYWVKIGTAWRAKTGEGYDLTFDALPIADKEGRVFVALREPKEKDGPVTRKAQINPYAELDDDIPFK